MARHYQDFVGLNTFIYEPNGWLEEEPDYIININQQNEIGHKQFVIGTEYGRIASLGRYKNEAFPFELPTTASFFNALMSHRGNVYGYSTWRQIRVSNNPLTRKQRRNNIFTYVKEPGAFNGTQPDRYGSINVFREPVVVDSYKPLSLVGDISVYNERQGVFQNRSVELRTSFGNETSFFAHKEIDEYYDTILETDDGYESLKELYLDGGLEDDGSPIEAFNLLIYRQSVFPKQQFSYLNRTRSRTFFINTFWRENREDRTETGVSTGFGTNVPSQSMWPLDVAEDWSSRAEPTAFVAFPDQTGSYYDHYIGGSDGPYRNAIIPNIGGFNTGLDTTPSLHGTPTPSSGASGILMNSYSQFSRGFYMGPDSWAGSFVRPFFDTNIANAEGSISASCYLSKRHSINSVNSVVSPVGMQIEETGSLSFISTGSLFEGLASWDCGRLAGKKPFYDSYIDFAEDVRLKGKGYSTVPEFRISSHVEEYLTKGVTEELSDIFELSGGLSRNTTTDNQTSFYKILSTSDFLKHFDIVKKDHKDFARESVLSLKCKAIKKFMPYEGFYPAEQSVEVAKSFYDSYSENFQLFDSSSNLVSINQIGLQAILEPLFAPGILFNTIKSGVAVDYPIILPEDNLENIFVDRDSKSGAAATSETLNSFFLYSDLSTFLASTSDWSFNSIFSKRIGFEALLEPEKLISDILLKIQDPHPFSLSELDYKIIWNGEGKELYKKKIHNYLSEICDFFSKNSNLKTISSLEEQDPNFGNAEAGNYYLARIKMKRTKNSPNQPLTGFNGNEVFSPQDIATKENLTMYSRPSAFGHPLWGTPDYSDSTNGVPLDPCYGYNFSYTPPYYYGESWCDLIFYADETRKYTLEEILSSSTKYPYYTRFWDPHFAEPIRDLTGYQQDDATMTQQITNNSRFSDYSNSAWKDLINIDNVQISGNQQNLYTFNQIPSSPTKVQWFRFQTEQHYWIPPNNTVADQKQVTAPHHPSIVNYNAMQLDSSINLFNKGTIREVRDADTDVTFEVASSDTVRGKTRWIIQPKFETPILNFNKYTNLEDNNCTVPQFASESVPRGMWHQYGELPEENEGVFLQVTDIPESWTNGALGLSKQTHRNKVKSLADLVGFPKEPVRLGEVADVKEISEAVVAVPFIEKNGTRQFFSIPRADIDSCIEATRREVEPGNFPAGGPPKAGDSVYQMVKKMQKYVFPPSMDFVRYKEIDPFAMYVFEFKHNLSKQDLADIWQNLPPEIGIKMEEAEATISHELLAHELLGGGAVVKNGTLDDNAEGNGIPSNIQWMIFKAKKRAKTNYFDKVVAKKGTTEDTSKKRLENASGQTGDDQDITYNWPYDFFSLVELVKLDAEVTFANIENDDKGQKTIKKVEKKTFAERREERRKTRGFNFARGKGRPKK